MGGGGWSWGVVVVAVEGKHTVALLPVRGASETGNDLVELVPH